MAALLAKATAMALAQHPVVNTTRKDGKSFTYYSSINIAIAVAINVWCVIDFLLLDLYLLSQKWKELVEKAQAKQLQPHEYNSGTFTLSKLGMFGVDRFDALLPLGQGDIMATRASKPTAIIGEYQLLLKELILTDMALARFCKDWLETVWRCHW
ncbi:hypothetical protein HYC85_017099 [Camellia sinensis]|uniref:2-oxoacid dehydrogenase acyltransferase catalytic domain-containing protein n=1 Tax=Camellia sinensis TaxID=4442 RepID=A0A7J7H3Q6_CAMSI|nr:hypothetical protein HYC85_017099 [Camellia sinensis]